MAVMPTFFVSLYCSSFKQNELEKNMFEDGFEEASRRTEEVPGLEQPQDHGEEGERFGIVVGARDEPEHLDL